MPVLSQGDIFEAVPRTQLAIVFGRSSFNFLGASWLKFKANYPQWERIQAPFSEFAGRPFELREGHWLWFVPEQQNQGLTDAQLTAALDEALEWASDNRIKSIATNGIANTDHGSDTAQNRQSDEQRAAYLETYATEAEQQLGVSIELISLSDIFVRDR